VGVHNSPNIWIPIKGIPTKNKTKFLISLALPSSVGTHTRTQLFKKYKNSHIHSHAGAMGASLIYDGKEYRLIQITGENKENEDVTTHYYKMLEAYENITFRNKKEFEKKLEYHIYRGYSILNSSLKANSSIYEFLLQEFV